MILDKIMMVFGIILAIYAVIGSMFVLYWSSVLF
jgi:hypothetical protein